tara:strand:- start:184 stop:555 length:372 start_codon:yes stop_codon:yes gene_type:complete
MTISIDDREDQILLERMAASNKPIVDLSGADFDQWLEAQKLTIELALTEQDIEVLLKALMSSPKSEHLTEGLLIRKLQSSLSQAQYAIKMHELGHDEQRSKDELREKTPKEIFHDLIAPTTED